MTAKKTLVAYLSASGETARLARTLADVTGGDLHEIVPAEPYTACLLYTSSAGTMHAASTQHRAAAFKRFPTWFPPSLVSGSPLSTDLVFAPTLAHRGLSLHPWPSRPSRTLAANLGVCGRCDLPLGCAMLVAANRVLRGSFRPHLPWTRDDAAPQLQTRKKQ